MNLIRDSAEAKVDIFVVFTTPMFLCPSSRTVPNRTFWYAGVCLVPCPGYVVTVGGSVLTRGLLRLTSGTSSLFVTVVVSKVFPYGAPPTGGGGFALPDPCLNLEVVAAALALGAVGALSRTEVAFPASPHLLGVSWAWFQPGRQPPPAKAL